MYNFAIYCYIITMASFIILTHHRRIFYICVSHSSPYSKKRIVHDPDAYYPSIDDGATGMRFIDACYESDQSGNCWVTV